MKNHEDYLACCEEALSKTKTLFFTYNFKDDVIENYSNSCSEILGYSKKQIELFNLNTLVSYCHPNDRYVITEKYFACFDPDFKNIVSTVLLRFKKANLQYTLFLCKIVLFKLDKLNIPLRSNIIATEIENIANFYESVGTNEFKEIVHNPAKYCTELTKRENEILAKYIVDFDIDGLSDKLNISINTTKTHIKNIYRKLEVHSIVELLKRINS